MAMYVPIAGPAGRGSPHRLNHQPPRIHPHTHALADVEPRALQPPAAEAQHRRPLRARAGTVVAQIARGAEHGDVSLRMGLVGRGIGSGAGGRRSRHGRQRRSAPAGGLGYVDLLAFECSNSPSCSREGGRVLEHGARPARRFPREGLVSLRTPGHR